MIALTVPPPLAQPRSRRGACKLLTCRKIAPSGRRSALPGYAAASRHRKRERRLIVRPWSVMRRAAVALDALTWREVESQFAGNTGVTAFSGFPDRWLMRHR